MLKNIIYIIATLIICFAQQMSNTAFANNSADSALIIAYNYIDNPIESSSSISIEQFRSHIKELKKGKYKILPLANILDSLHSGKTLPDNSVAIIFDNYHKDTITKALPILKEANIPFTIFYNAENINDTNELKKLNNESLINLGIVAASEDSLIEKDAVAITKTINQSIGFHEDNFKNRPQLFKYPDGEYSNEVIKIVSSYKFKGAITENLGAIGQKSNFNLLPVVNISREYGDLDLFISALNLRYLDYDDILPQDNILENATPLIGFTLKSEEIQNYEDISCFASDIGRLETTVIEQKRVEIRLNKPLIYRKTSINCTILVRNKDIRDNSWKSFSTTLIKKGEE